MFLDTDLRTLTAIWLLVAAAVVMRHWRAGRGVGLIFCYVLNFAAIHWLGAVVNLFPWYIEGDLELTQAGLRQSTIGIIAFAIGAECAAAMITASRRREDREIRDLVSIEPRFVNVLLFGGLIIYGVMAPLAANAPSLAGVLSTGSGVIVAAFCLKCWNAWQAGAKLRLAGWLAASLLFPFVTVVSQGFLGFGFAALVILFAFLASFWRARVMMVVGAVAASYIGLSVYVTYMRDRTEIREVVWGGESTQRRIDRLGQTFQQIEWFSIYDEHHLYRIDARLNQNYLIGAAAGNLEPGYVKFAYGATIAEAALAVIPRAIWRDKPMTAGSGDLVSIYTGLRFPAGTSVGIGHIMEWYVNFGTIGVGVGLFLIGAVLTFIDWRASAKLHTGDAHGFITWYLPGLSLLLVGGSFIEATSGAAASVLMAFLLNRGGAALQLRPGDSRLQTSTPMFEQVRR